MFQVMLVYNIDTPKGPRQETYTDTWIVKQQEKLEALNEALSNSQAVVRSSWGYDARVLYEDAILQPLEVCATCVGSGHCASMDGFYPCTNCQGKKYVEVEQFEQG